VFPVPTFLHLGHQIPHGRMTIGRQRGRALPHKPSIYPSTVYGTQFQCFIIRKPQVDEGRDTEQGFSRPGQSVQSLAPNFSCVTHNMNHGE
jgi:hypothetical protein